MIEDDITTIKKSNHIVFWLGVNLTIIVVTACMIWYESVKYWQKFESDKKQYEYRQRVEK